MKFIKLLLFSWLLLFSTAAFSQVKKPQPQADVPTPPPPPPPPPKASKGHPWTRNGEDVWVMEPPKPAIPVKPSTSPIPPPPPPKGIKNKKAPR